MTVTYGFSTFPSIQLQSSLRLTTYTLQGENLYDLYTYMHACGGFFAPYSFLTVFPQKALFLIKCFFFFFYFFFSYILLYKWKDDEWKFNSNKYNIIVWYFRVRHFSKKDWKLIHNESLLCLLNGRNLGCICVRRWSEKRESETKRIRRIHLNPFNID